MHHQSDLHSFWMFLNPIIITCLNPTGVADSSVSFRASQQPQNRRKINRKQSSLALSFFVFIKLLQQYQWSNNTSYIFDIKHRSSVLMAATEPLHGCVKATLLVLLMSLADFFYNVVCFLHVSVFSFLCWWMELWKVLLAKGYL